MIGAATLSPVALLGATALILWAFLELFERNRRG